MSVLVETEASERKSAVSMSLAFSLGREYEIRHTKLFNITCEWQEINSNESPARVQIVCLRAAVSLLLSVARVKSRERATFNIQMRFEREKEAVNVYTE